MRRDDATKAKLARDQLGDLGLGYIAVMQEAADSEKLGVEDSGSSRSTHQVVREQR